MSESVTKPRVAESVIWHDAECGGYSADLPLWEQLTSGCERGVADLGCGTGRVALHLGRLGHQVTGVDIKDAFIAELDRRAAMEGLSVEGWKRDVRDLESIRRFDLMLAPMQLIQLLATLGERLACLRAVQDHLNVEGRAAFAIVGPPPVADGDLLPIPDVREVDGWVYSSLPLSVETTGGSIQITRLRQAVSPSGEMNESTNVERLALITAEELEAEATDAGLQPIDRVEIPATADHLGSSVVVMERL